MYKSIQQIQQEYDGYWVYIINCEKDEHHSVIGGEVLFYGKSMNEVLQRMRQYDKVTDSVYVRYFGELPQGVAGVL